MSTTPSPKFDLTQDMVNALNELGREVDKDHLCDRCLNKMNTSLGYIAGLRVVLYECPACEHLDVREFLG